MINTPDALRSMVRPKNPEEEQRRNWTLYGAGTLFLCWGGSGASALAAPAGLAIGGIAVAGIDGLRKLANSPENTWARTAARTAWRIMFGEEGKEQSQATRRLLDFAASIGLSVVLGGATVSALLIGLAGGAAITIVTSWTESAPASWRNQETEKQ